MKASFSRRATHLREFMDDPACDEEKLFNTYRHFASINRCISGWRGLYRHWLRPEMDSGRAHRLLDIGFGGGDVARALARWAASDGLRLDVTGIEQDARALDYVGGQAETAHVRFRAATAREMIAAGEEFDFVVSNAVMHHLGDEEIKTLAAESQTLARRLVLHNDIRRHGAAFALFPLWAGPCFRGSFALADGLTSIRRSLTRVELQALLPAGWVVREKFPFRLLATYRK